MPEDWIYPVQGTSEEGFFELAERLPSEAAEALLEYATTGILRRPEPVSAPAAEVPDPFLQDRKSTRLNSSHG